VFSPEDQQSFAAWSGDRNPMHLDPVAARRTQAGAVVVHGMHALLWTLDVLASAQVLAQAPVRIVARFKKFLYVGATLSMRPSARSNARYEIVVDGVVAASFEFLDRSDDDSSAAGAQIAVEAGVAVPLEPLERTFEELGAVGGRLAVPGAPAAAGFASAAALIGTEATCGIAALSALVGMIAPGLHSIFDGIDVALAATRSDGLAYEVVEADDRFRQIVMRVDGSGICGEVRAFVRQPPVAPDRTALQEIASGAFARTRALVVGGSRGLGAATVRALAAGGARVDFTYARGEADARALASELGASVTASRLDVSGDALAGLEGLPGPYDQLYYFATPQIAGQRATSFSNEAFASFCDFYVRGFAIVSDAIAKRSPALRIYYPSSVYVEVERRPRDMLEYAMAKAAGETLCRELPRVLRGVSVVVDRLARTRTDQTASVVPVDMDSAERAAVRLVRRMHAD
jgi:NAD(P)-dependent dehydrogenase (short-subunit alcohol dehydrogenase family)/acyl dehydratase